MCIIWKPSVTWNWSYFLETLNSCHNWRFLFRVTLKFDGWPCKTKWHLFYATSSLVHHLMAMGEFKLELQSRNAQFKSKSTIFVLYDLEIWRLALKNNKGPLLCHIKLCASFQLPSVTLTLDLWSLPIAWTSLLSWVITPEFRNEQSVLGNVIIFIFQLLKVTWQKRIYVIGEKLYGTIFFHKASFLTYQKLCL